MRQHRRVWSYRALAAAWALLTIPAIVWWSRSVLFVILVSLYANAAASWTAGEAADDLALTERLDRIEALLKQRGGDDG
jgi:hypothetical protein